MQSNTPADNDMSSQTLAQAQIQEAQARDEGNEALANPALMNPQGNPAAADAPGPFKFYPNIKTRSAF